MGFAGLARRKGKVRCLLRKAIRDVECKIEVQEKNDGTNEEGVLGRESGLTNRQKLFLGEERSLSEIFRRPTL